MKSTSAASRLVSDDKACGTPQVDCPLVGASIDVGSCPGCRFYRGVEISGSGCCVRCTYVAAALAHRLVV